MMCAFNYNLSVHMCTITSFLGEGLGLGLFTMGTGGNYITMLPTDWSISTSHDPMPSNCHSEKILCNPSIAFTVHQHRAQT